tara:strand:- start:431 stop:541 length:111 start_codon:yes stop_codon:yes gene_type:complete
MTGFIAAPVPDIGDAKSVTIIEIQVKAGDNLTHDDI